MILTHEEAKSLSYSSDNVLDVIRNTEQAVIAKLSQGVSVEPVLWASERCGQKVFTLDQLQTTIAAARVQAINDCAKLIDNTIVDGLLGSEVHAACLRALIGKEST